MPEPTKRDREIAAELLNDINWEDRVRAALNEGGEDAGRTQ